MGIHESVSKQFAKNGEHKHRSDRLGLPKTDLQRWTFRASDLGAQWWEYDDKSSIEDIQSKSSDYVKYSLNLPGYTPVTLREDVQKPVRNARDAALKNWKLFASLQDPDSGAWQSQYGGPQFMNIGFVTACYFGKNPIPDAVKTEMIRYIVNTAHPVDGGWGLHTEDKSTCFGTTINYVVLRLLGLPAEHPVCVKAQKTLLTKFGGAINNPHWGKTWLAVLNLYKWEGVNPAPGELWLLPYIVPAHPGRWWVHTRWIYLAMGYLEAAHAQCELDDLLTEIRAEIFTRPFDEIDFSKKCNSICGVDLYYPHTRALKFANAVLRRYRSLRPQWIKDKVKEEIYSLCLKEIANTRHLCLAPVNNAMTSIVMYVHEGPDSPNYKKIASRWKEFLSLNDAGMFMNGTNGLQVWDTAFAVQFACMCGFAELPEYQKTIRDAFDFLDRSQINETTEEGSYRDTRIGGWPFSTKTQGYPVSDCTAEAMKAVIMVQNTPGYEDLKRQVSEERLETAIDLLLGMQNTGSFEPGSFASYEPIRASSMLESINPAEVFGNIMVEYPYVECTDSVVLGLSYFRKYHTYRSDDVDKAIKGAIDYIIREQQPDGGFFGSWGVCYCYAHMFAMEALETQKLNYGNCETVVKACDFLAGYQEADGGWAEDFKSCETQMYIRGPNSLSVPTAMALLSLMSGGYPDEEAIHKGAKYLMSKQMSNGEWLKEEMEGVFNHTCAIEYPNYRFYFVMKALGVYYKKYGR